MATTKKKITKKKTSKKTTPAKTTDKTLSETQAIEEFCQAIMEGCSQSDAYRRANKKAQKWQPEAVHTKASEFAKKGEVQVRLKELKAVQYERHNITVDRVLKELSRVAFFNVQDLYDMDTGMLRPISEIPRDTLAAITQVDFDSVNGVRVLKKVKALDKDKALVNLGKWLKMWSDFHIPPGGTGNYPGTINFNQFNIEKMVNMDQRQAYEAYRAFKDADQLPES